MSSKRASYVMPKWLCLLLILMLALPSGVMAASEPAAPEFAAASTAGSLDPLPGHVGYIESDVDPATGALGHFSYNNRLELDYRLRSIGIDLGAARPVNQLEIAGSTVVHRVEKQDLSLYVSQDNLTYTKVKDWDLVKVGADLILYNFSENARYIKVHSHHEDMTGTVYNGQLQQMLKAFHLPPGQFTASGGGSWQHGKEIVVANPANAVLKDRAVYISKAGLDVDGLITAGKLQANLADVRFADASGRELHYFTDAGGFYVRIPELQPLGQTTISFVYGNAQALYRGQAKEALQIEYGNKTLIPQEGEIKPLRLNDGTLMMLAGSNTAGVTARYSYNDGRTWTNAETLIPAQLSGGLYQFPGGGYVDPVTGEVIIFFSVHHYFGVWSGGSSCLDINVCRNDMYVAKSTGYNGSKPVFGQAEQLTGYQTPSGTDIHYLLSYTNPIRLSTGRIIEPFSYVIGNDGTFGVGFLYSDDDGDTWVKSPSELSIPSVGGEGGVTEVAIAELSDGSLKTYMRQQRGDLFSLGTSSSADGGVTWTAVTDSEVMSTNTFPAMSRDERGDLLLTWSGHNAMGASSYLRNNLTIAYSSDETASWQGYRDLLGRTSVSRPGWGSYNETRTVVQADAAAAGEDGMLFAWSGPAGQYALLVEDFDRYLRDSHGALDSFEYERPIVGTDNGSSLADEYWWKTVAGTVYASSDRATTGTRSLRVHNQLTDSKMTAASRLFPAVREASVQFDVYGAALDGDVYLSLQEGYSQHWNALGAAFILRIDEEGELQYTDVKQDSSSSQPRIGFVNPDSNPLVGNLTNFGELFMFALDYKDRSIGADLGRAAQIQSIKLVDSKTYNKPQPPSNAPGSRLTGDHLEVYVSDSNSGNWTKVNGWTHSKVDGNIILDFTGVNVEARFVKVHQSFSDTGFTFAAPQQEMMVIETNLNQPVVFNPLPVQTFLTAGSWNTVRIDFDLAAGEAEVLVNGVSRGTIEAAHPGEVVNHFMIAAQSELNKEVIVDVDTFMLRDTQLGLPQPGAVGAEQPWQPAEDATPPSIAFTPGGNETVESQASAAVSVQDDWSGVDAGTLEYVWSQSSTAPATGWQSFVNGGTLTKSGGYGDWYLHIRVSDYAGNPAAATSQRFRLPAAPGGSYIGSVSSDAPLASSVTVQPGRAAMAGYSGELTVAVMTGALKKSFKLSIDKLAAAEAGKLLGDREALGEVFAVRADAGAGFAAPMAITFHLDEEAASRYGDAAVIHWYDAQQQTWVPLASRSFEGAVTAAAEQLGVFAVFAVEEDVEPGVPEQAAFADVDGHWAAAAVADAAAAGIVTGYEDGTFRPNADVSRQEFIAMLVRSVGLQAAEGEADGSGETAAAVADAFSDRESIGAWALAAVRQALTAGVIDGYDDGSFRPAGAVNRVEAAAMLIRALGLETTAGARSTFADEASIPGWARELAAAAEEAGLLTGRSGNRLEPLQPLTRAEAVTLLLRVKALAD